jgi:hypothetical protein
METQSGPICCPRLEPNLWDDKILQWENKKFIKDSICTFMFMPFNFGQVMRRCDKKITHSGATIPDALSLSEHVSKWKMDIFLAVDKDIAGADNVTFSGKFYSKVYEGPFQNTEKWCKDYETVVKSKGLTIKKMYMWYTTCPRCAKKYGKNYVVIISQVE